MIVITPCSRRENIPILEESMSGLPRARWIIVYDAESSPVVGDPIRRPNWVICMQWCKKSEPAWVAGHGQRNSALDWLEKEVREYDDSWIYNLDDDTIVHPHLKEILSDPNRPEDLISFDTHWKRGDKWAGFNGTDSTQCDTGSFLVRWGLMKNFRWQPDDYQADQKLIRELWKAAKSPRYIPEQAAWYNYLSPRQPR